MITIGILGSRGKSKVAKILEEKLKEYGKSIYIIGTSEKSAYEFEKLLYCDIDYIIIEISREDILGESINKIKFDIIIQTSLENENEEFIEQIQNIISCIREDGYIIFDSDSLQKINFVCEKIYPITYGLNGKTTVTASSIDDVESLCFSYCLQRAIFTITGTVVQPFEKPIRIDEDYNNIIYLLGAFTCIIILGYGI